MNSSPLKPLRVQSFADEPILVSVAMIAYNVSEYIVEGIESILDQEVNFRVEIVIGEDCSTDDTRAIVLGYQERYPTVIRVLEHPTNLGLTPNCVETINACKGKWVALCDGDDYWTNVKKLAIQLDFLSKSTNYAGSAHQSHKIYMVQEKLPELFGAEADQDYHFEDMLSDRKFHTSGFVFRRSIWTKYGGIPKDISSNERAIFPMIAMDGPIKYFGQSMCVYRLTGSGLTSRVDYRELITDLKMISWLHSLDSTLSLNKFRSFLHQCVYNYGHKPVPMGPLIKHYMAFVYFSFSYFPKNLGDLRWGTIFFLRKLKKSFI